jgi:hypothetical protein
MTLGKTLQIPGAAAARQDAQDRHQQQQPLRVADASALAAFRQRLQEGDQISSGSGVGQRTRAVPTKPAPAWPHQPTRDRLSVGPGGGLTAVEKRGMVCPRVSVYDESFYNC